MTSGGRAYPAVLEHPRTVIWDLPQTQLHTDFSWHVLQQYVVERGQVVYQFHRHWIFVKVCQAAHCQLSFCYSILKYLPRITGDYLGIWQSRSCVHSKSGVPVFERFPLPMTHPHIQQLLSVHYILGQIHHLPLWSSKLKLHTTD